MVDVDALLNWALHHQGTGDSRAALECYREVLKQRPEHEDAMIFLAALAYKEGFYEESVQCLEAIIERAPKVPMFYVQLGRSLTALGLDGKAEKILRKAVALAPRAVATSVALARVIMSQDRFEEAERLLRNAISLNNNNAMAHFSLAELLLVTGRFEEGWEQYEWRFKAISELDPNRSPVKFPRVWNGMPLMDGKLLITCEQGAGDCIQFCRLVAIAARRSRIVFRCRPDLFRLFRAFSDVANVVEDSGPIPNHQAYCPLLSLPSALKLSMDSIPNEVPYLFAESTLTGAWQTRLAGLKGVRVGLAWSGASNSAIPAQRERDRRRNVTLAELAPLARVPNIDFVSLQKGRARDELINMDQSFQLRDWTEELKDYMDTAALIEGLDLVISVDTSVAHLAAAMGKPTWMLDRFDACWRWLRKRTDSPWYPTLKIFRQPTAGDWRSAVLDVRDCLSRLEQTRAHALRSHA